MGYLLLFLLLIVKLINNKTIMRGRNQNSDNSLQMIGLAAVLLAIKYAVVVLFILTASYGIYYFLKKNILIFFRKQGYLFTFHVLII